MSAFIGTTSRASSAASSVDTTAVRDAPPAQERSGALDAVPVAVAVAVAVGASSTSLLTGRCPYCCGLPIRRSPGTTTGLRPMICSLSTRIAMNIKPTTIATVANNPITLSGAGDT